jgi:hypothetical protein
MLGIITLLKQFFIFVGKAADLKYSLGFIDDANLTSKAGDVFEVMYHKWIKVMNQSGISNGNSFFAFGDSASIDLGTTIEVISSDGGGALVECKRYKKAYGALAPSGSRFRIDLNQYRKLSSGEDPAEARQYGIMRDLMMNGF